MEEVDPDVARWAVASGLPVIAEVVTRLEDGEDALAVGTTLRRSVAPERAAFAVAAAQARRRALAAGVPGADRIVLTREAAEQASHPLVAGWRADRLVAVRASLTGGRPPLVDLCAGTGADAVMLAIVGGPVVAVERDRGRAVLAAHRALVLDVPVDVVVGDALAPPVGLADRVVHADPDRRDGSGRRLRRLGEHRPSVAALLGATAPAAATAITVAPGVDWADEHLPDDAGLTFLELEGRLVEAVLEHGGAVTARARAVRLPGPVVEERTGPVPRLPVGPIGTHLLLPSPAIVRARLHDRVGHRVAARRVADRRALLTSDGAVDDPWLRCEEVVDVLPPRPRALRRWLRSRTGVHEAAAGVEIVLHGIRVDPVRVLREAGATTGPHGVRVHLVRRDDDAVAVVTRAR